MLTGRAPDFAAPGADDLYVGGDVNDENVVRDLATRPALTATDNIEAWLNRQLDTLQDDIARMQDFADTRGLDLRPPVKAHKCLEIGRLQVDAGACGITAGTMHEAEIFAAGGFLGILIAYPIWAAGSKPARTRHLAESIRLRVGVDSTAAIDRLADTMRGASSRLDVVVEVDCGARRSGVPPERAGELARYAAKVGLAPIGVYIYPGQGGSSPDARRPAADEQRPR